MPRQNPDLFARLEAALARRQRLIERPDLTAYRLFHSASDGIPGLVIERLGPALIVQLHEAQLSLSEDQVRTVAQFFHERLGTQGVYRKFFVKDRARPSAAVDAEHHAARPWIGSAVEPEVIVEESGLRFVVRPYDGFSTGLFLEQRENRLRVREWAKGGRVLNTFSYTCTFSAAAAGGGAAVDSVDVYKRYLEWGKANFTANGLDHLPHRFFASDTLSFFRRAQRQGRAYDLVILDPPTFARLRRPQRAFVLDEQLEALCAGAVARVSRGGRLLLSTNARGLSGRRLESAVAAAAGRRRYRLEPLSLPVDFAGDPDYARSFLASFAD